MGGSRSGRWCGRPTSEATQSYILSASALRALRRDYRADRGDTLEFGDGFEVKFRLIGDGYDPYFRFTHAIRAGDERETTYTVALKWTPCRFGGGRWWWLCPRLHIPVFKLFLPLGGHQFWSRRAYRLGFACQRETLLDRRIRRAGKLYRALGGTSDALDADPPEKPKGMHWDTYEARLAQWHSAAEEACALGWDKTLRWVGRGGYAT